jgi:hypothetical protein
MKTRAESTGMSDSTVPPPVMTEAHLVRVETERRLCPVEWEERIKEWDEIVSRIRAEVSGEIIPVPRKMMDEIEAWSMKEFGISYTELWNRREDARLHPERLIPHEEVMRRLDALTPDTSKRDTKNG